MPPLAGVLQAPMYCGSLKGQPVYYKNITPPTVHVYMYMYMYMCTHVHVCVHVVYVRYGC